MRAWTFPLSSQKHSAGGWTPPAQAKATEALVNSTLERIDKIQAGSDPRADMKVIKLQSILADVRWLAKNMEHIELDLAVMQALCDVPDKVADPLRARIEASGGSEALDFVGVSVAWSRPPSQPRFMGGWRVCRC